MTEAWIKVIRTLSAPPPFADGVTDADIGNPSVPNGVVGTLMIEQLLLSQGGVRGRRGENVC
jgi:hypothetical protein